EAAQMSQQAIEELAKGGRTDKTVDKIATLWPAKGWVGAEDGHAIPLQNWHDEVLHDICTKEIFPGVVDSFNSDAARARQSQLVEGGLRDDATPPPLRPNLGDFVTPRGNPMG